jgi:D-alanyl-D-alanine-carboxypeptidase/D-alanyl-D-alanine-endopeptidase
MTALLGWSCQHNASKSSVKATKITSGNQTQMSVDEVVNSHLVSKFSVGAVVGIVGIVNSEGKKVSLYGVTDLETGSPPAEDTLYEIASISKVFTGTILSGLVHEKDAKLAVQLNDPISKYLDGLTNPKTASITLEELTTHTSGLPSIPNNLLKTAPIFAPYAGYTAELLIEFLNDYDGIDDTVDKHPISYSNLGVGLLGYVLTKRTGKSYDQLLTQYVTGPLGMMDTVSTMSKSQRSRYATPYYSFLDEGERADFGVLLGNGAMLSTANDMMKFIKANLNPDETPIAEVLKFAQKTHRSDGKTNMGLGWFVDQTSKGEHHQHAGGNSFFNSYVTFDKHRNLGYVVLTNTGTKIQCLTEIIMMEKACVPEFGVDVPEDTLEQYVGRYKHDSSPAEMIIELKRGFLTYESVGSEKGRLTAKPDGSFTVLDAFAMKFNNITNGKSEEMSLEQGNAKFIFNRQ